MQIAEIELGHLESGFPILKLVSDTEKSPKVQPNLVSDERGQRYEDVGFDEPIPAGEVMQADAAGLEYSMDFPEGTLIIHHMLEHLRTDHAIELVVVKRQPIWMYFYGTQKALSRRVRNEIRGVRVDKVAAEGIMLRTKDATSAPSPQPKSRIASGGAAMLHQISTDAIKTCPRCDALRRTSARRPLCLDLASPFRPARRYKLRIQPGVPASCFSRT